MRVLCLSTVGLTLVLCQVPSGAQWTNRYPKVTGFNHHVYLEGFDLPVVSTGPNDPAPSPDGRAVAFTARGWLWLQDLATGEARRLTRGSALDVRPAWAPDGRTIVFVRDDTKDTSLVSLDLASGRETVIVDTPAMDLDPVYSRDGKVLFYASAEAGDFDLYRRDLTTGAVTRITSDKGLELRPQPLSDGRQIVFLSKQASNDTVAVLDIGAGTRRVLAEAPIASQMRPALDPTGRLVATGLPGPDGWAIWLYDIAGGPPVRLVAGHDMPITPAWSADGSAVYFADADRERTFRLWRVPRGGGPPARIDTLAWQWGEPTARVRIRTTQAGTPRPARLHVADRDGHPVLPDTGQAWFDGQNGLVFFYAPGSIDVEVPAGPVRVVATAGFASPAATATVEATPGRIATADLSFSPLATPQRDGWYSGDLHFHLNYGGPYTLEPGDLVEMMRGEDLDVGTPLMANLHTRILDLPWADWRRSTMPLIAFGQEIRPHFLGHTAGIGLASPYWPWFWGPGYPVFGRDDRPGGAALAHVRAQGGVSAYVHPVSRPGPFTPGQPPAGLPLALVPDALHGDVDTLEVACLWSDELGTSDAWYRLLNVGIPIAPSAGTDVMTNFYRTMAVGTTRVFVQVEGPLTFDRYLAGLRAGRSYVTTGPLLMFAAQGHGPGSALTAPAGADVPWTLNVASPVSFEHVEVLVNGRVVWSDRGLASPGRKTWAGTIKAPAGGWMAARVRGGAAQWPAMESYPFAHTAALWFGRVGSTDPEAARTAARDLLAWMDVADARLAEGYAGAEIPVLRERFTSARRTLETLAASSR